MGKIGALLDGNPWLWRFRSVRDRFKFEVAKRIFISGIKSDRSTTVARMAGLFALHELWRLPLTIVAVAIALAIDQLLHLGRADLHSLAIYLPGVSQTDASAVVIAVFGALVLVLGLYYAGFTSLATVAYARVPGDVRELVLTEFVSISFLRLCSATATFALAMSIAKAFGFQIGHASLAVLGVGTAATIEAFVTVGVRSFRLFDPSSLVPVLQGEISKAIVGAAKTGFMSSNNSIQAKYQDTAGHCLATYQHLTEIAQDQPQALSILTEFGLTLFVFYTSQKHRIPIGSAWFQERYRHRDWLIEGEPLISVSLAASVALQPERVPDESWFERRLTIIISRAMRGIHQQTDPILIAKFDRRLAECVRLAAFSHAAPDALALARQLTIGFTEFIAQAKASDDERMAIVVIDVADTIALMGIHVALGITQRLKATANNDVGALATVVVGNRRPSSGSVPRSTLTEVAELSRRQALENVIERQPITPVNYITARIGQTLLDSMWASMADVMAYFEATTFQAANSLKTSGGLLAAAAIFSRLIEASAKTVTLCDSFAEKLAELKAGSSAAVHWVEYDVASIRKRATKLRRESVLELIASVLRLPIAPGGSDVPDLLGQAYHVASVEAYDALTAGDGEYFESIAKLLPALGVVAIRRTYAALEHGNWRVGCGQIAADLLELSGYAMLYSELQGVDLWSEMRSSWDRIVDDNSNFFELVVSLAYYLEELPALTTQGVMRVDWTRRFEDRLSELHLLSDRAYRSFEIAENVPIIVRRNSTLRVVCDTQFSQTVMLDAFVVKYAMKRGLAAVTSSRQSVTRFLEDLQRAKRNPAFREQRERRQRQRARWW